jgi:hypothetical protein
MGSRQLPPTQDEENFLATTPPEPKDSKPTETRSEPTNEPAQIVLVTGRQGGIGFTAMPGRFSPRSSAKTTEPPGPPPSYTAEEFRRLAEVARTKGWRYAQEHAAGILASPTDPA